MIKKVGEYKPPKGRWEEIKKEVAANKDTLAEKFMSAELKFSEPYVTLDAAQKKAMEEFARRLMIEQAREKLRCWAPETCASGTTAGVSRYCVLNNKDHCGGS